METGSLASTPTLQTSIWYSANDQQLCSCPFLPLHTSRYRSPRRSLSLIAAANTKPLGRHPTHDMTGTTALVPIVSASASSSTTSTSSTLSAYELDRLAQIRANDALFRSLGLAPDDPVARVKRPASQRPVYEKVRSSPRKRQRSERNVEPRNTNGLVNGGHGWNGKLGQANSAYRRAEGAERVVGGSHTGVQPGVESDLTCCFFSRSSSYCRDRSCRCCSRCGSRKEAARLGTSSTAE